MTSSKENCSTVEEATDETIENGSDNPIDTVKSIDLILHRQFLYLSKSSLAQAR